MKRPPVRCPWCGSYDSWGELPRPVRNPGAPELGIHTTYEDWWTCGICYRVWRVPLPVPPLTRIDPT